MSPRKSLPQTPIDHSSSPASSGWGLLTRKSRPFFKDLQNTVSLQATEDGRYSIEQSVSSTSPPFPAIDKVSPKRRGLHRRANAEYLASSIAIPFNPRSKLVPPPSPDAMLGSARVDLLVLSYDTSPEEDNIAIQRSSSVVINNGNYNVDIMCSPLPLSPDSSHTEVPYHCTQVVKPRRVPLNHRRVINRNALVLTVPLHSLTLPLSSPTLSSSPISDLVSKRSGRTFDLVSVQDHFLQAVETDLTGGRIESPPDILCSSSPPQCGFHPDMLAMLQELEELATWIRECTHPEGDSEELDALSASSTTCPHALERLETDLDYHLLRRPVLKVDKGKGRMLTENMEDIDSVASEPPSPTNRPATPSTRPSLVRRRRSLCYIYDPSRSPSFLVGSSTSPIVYPAEGYSSLPPPYGSRSAPNVSPSFLMSALFVTSLKAFFKRSRSNTMSVTVPQTNAFGRDKKMPS